MLKTFFVKTKIKTKTFISYQDQDRDSRFQDQDQDQDLCFCPRGASRPRPWSRGHHCLAVSATVFEIFTLKDRKLLINLSNQLASQNQNAAARAHEFL